MKTEETVTLMEAIRDIEFAVSEPYKNAANSEGPKYRDLLTSMTLIMTIVRETKNALNMK